MGCLIWWFLWWCSRSILAFVLFIIWVFILWFCHLFNQMILYVWLIELPMLLQEVITMYNGAISVVRSHKSNVLIEYEYVLQHPLMSCVVPHDPYLKLYLLFSTIREDTMWLLSRNVFIVLFCSRHVDMLDQDKQSCNNWNKWWLNSIWLLRKGRPAHPHTVMAYWNTWTAQGHYIWGRGSLC